MYSDPDEIEGNRKKFKMVTIIALIVNKMIGGGIWITPFTMFSACGSKSEAVGFWVAGGGWHIRDD